jgi:hypothetical protein
MTGYTWQFELGALIRKHVLHELKTGAAKCGVKFTVLSDDGGWISTAYTVRVEGSEENVGKYRRTCEQYVKRLAKEYA